MIVSFLAVEPLALEVARPAARHLVRTALAATAKSILLRSITASLAVVLRLVVWQVGQPRWML